MKLESGDSQGISCEVGRRVELGGGRCLTGPPSPEPGSKSLLGEVLRQGTSGCRGRDRSSCLREVGGRGGPESGNSWGIGYEVGERRTLSGNSRGSGYKAGERRVELGGEWVA